ncbi:hypothetical protein [Arenimonas oryziterrae]|uniref:Uncharacterized protein n=1 Tax=Arenimonas oryziterrae DSM 21050 = YC6267 TaxID=1121015 RepID=A0A091AWI4_9GAMM|nr:hypothetical protein [Arenimonas oryziterrae]KFN44658.1 hypothetical protein N789_01210 [Arenimonas oryziterrae DSM 21050 = YC6267]
MNTFKWLMKREYWEHKGGLFWSQIVVGGLMVLMMGITFMVALGTGKMQGMHVNGTEMHSLAEAVTPEVQVKMVEGISTVFVGSAAPLFIVLSFVLFFYFLGSLFDDRSNRSVLFWKSLPISDRDTVLSKLATALVVAPVISLVIATIVGLLITILMLGSLAVAGVNLFGPVFSTARTYTLPLEFFASLPVYMVWALPTAGWLLMISAWARTKPFLWAVGIPLVTGGLLSWTNAMLDLNWKLEILWRAIGRLLLSVVPGSWSFLINDPGRIQADALDHGSPLSAAWAVMTTPEMWIGAVVGIAMIVVAVRLRRFRDEG